MRKEFIPVNSSSYWRKLGKYLGYPDCCVTWFIERNTYELTIEQEAVHGGMGFVPCPECAKKVSKETIHTLIKGRQCPTPFPIFKGKEREDFQRNYKY